MSGDLKARLAETPDGPWHVPGRSHEEPTLARLRLHKLSREGCIFRRRDRARLGNDPLRVKSKHWREPARRLGLRRSCLEQRSPAARENKLSLGITAREIRHSDGALARLVNG